MLRLLLLSVSLSAVGAPLEEPCAVPRRDLSALEAAIASDQQMGLVFERAARACRESRALCDESKLTCAGALAEVSQKQVGFDEGQYVRDMLMPVLGQRYMPSQTFDGIATARDTGCGFDPEELRAAGERRLQQATRRIALVAEYRRFEGWVLGVEAQCAAELQTRQQQAAAARAEAEALAAQAALETAVQAQAMDAKAQTDLAAEHEKIAGREAQKAEQRKKRAARLADAQREIDVAKDQAKARREQALMQLELEEKQTMREAEKRASVIRDEAGAIVVDDDDERSVASVALLAAAGAQSWVADANAARPGMFLGASAVAHFGVWKLAPAEGMASGFLTRVSLRFLQSIDRQSSRSFEGDALVHWYLGRFGIGAGALLQLLEPIAAISAFSIGPSVGFALVDNRRLRILGTVQWMPVGSKIDWSRTLADIELSAGYFSLHVNGGLQMQHAQVDRLSWQVGVLIGVRLGW